MPVLVLVDVQKEYVAKGRAFFLETIGKSLDNIKRLLAHARKEGWKIVHMRHQQNAEYFTYGSPFSDYIDGYEPHEGEESYTKPNFSCFSNREFQALMDKYRHEDIILAGYGATMCCLSTMVDAHHRGIELAFVGDASCARRTPRFGEQDMLEHILDIMGAFGTVVTTSQVLGTSAADRS